MSMKIKSFVYLLASVVLCDYPWPGIAQTNQPGKAQYIMSCASCHGEKGEGNGPSAQAFRTPPPDLTMLSKNNDGVFPNEILYRIIDGTQTLRAHGNYEMPVWGRKFTRKQITSIADYLKAIQAK